MDAYPQGAFRNTELLSHDSVLLDFVVSFVNVVIENQIPFFRRQEAKALQQALVFIALLNYQGRRLGDFLLCNFLWAIPFLDQIASEPPKKMGAFANVLVRQSLARSAEGLIGHVLSSTEPFGREDPYQTPANVFVFFGRDVAVRIQPG